MAKYAVVNPDNSIAEFRTYASPPVANTDNPAKPRLLPVVLQDVVTGVDEVREGPAYTVEVARVLETYSKRAKSADEVQAMRDRKIANIRSLGEFKLGALVTLAKQVQALTVLVRLLYANTIITGWPANQQTMAANRLARLTDIANIRQVEDTKVAEVQALATPAAIEAYDVQAGW